MFVIHPYCKLFIVNNATPSIGSAISGIIARLSFRINIIPPASSNDACTILQDTCRVFPPPSIAFIRESVKYNIVKDKDIIIKNTPYIGSHFVGTSNEMYAKYIRSGINIVKNINALLWDELSFIILYHYTIIIYDANVLFYMWSVCYIFFFWFFFAFRLLWTWVVFSMQNSQYLLFFVLHRIHSYCLHR